MNASIRWACAVGMVLATGCGGEIGRGGANGSSGQGAYAGASGSNANAAATTFGAAAGTGNLDGGAAAAPGPADLPDILGGGEAGSAPTVVVSTASSPPLPPPPSQVDIVTLSADQTCPWGMAIDATSVYWTDCGDPTGGYVLKVPKSGGAIETLATGDRLSGVAVDGTNVYWVAGTEDASSGAIMAVPVGGGTPTVLASRSGAPAHIAVDASYVYWVELDEGAVMKAPVGGGAPTTVASATAPWQLALGDTAIFWLGAEGLMTAPKTGGAAVGLTPALPELPSAGLAVNGSNVYFTGGVPAGSPGVSEVPIDGGAIGVVSQTAPSTGGGPIAIDVARAYWADTTSGAIYAAPLTGGAAILLAVGQDNVVAIAVDDTAVYWLVNGNGTPGGVMKLALSAVDWP